MPKKKMRKNCWNEDPVFGKDGKPIGSGNDGCGAHGKFENAYADAQVDISAENPGVCLKSSTDPITQIGKSCTIPADCATGEQCYSFPWKRHLNDLKNIVTGGYDHGGMTDTQWEMVNCDDVCLCYPEGGCPESAQSALGTEWTCPKPCDCNKAVRVRYGAQCKRDTLSRSMRSLPTSSPSGI